MPLSAVLAPAPPVDLGPVENPLPKLLTGEDLPIEDAQHLFERLVLGKLEPAEIAGMLIALRMKGETAEVTCNGEVIEKAFKVPAAGGIGLEADRGQMEYRRIRMSRP